MDNPKPLSPVELRALEIRASAAASIMAKRDARRPLKEKGDRTAGYEILDSRAADRTLDGYDALMMILDPSEAVYQASIEAAERELLDEKLRTRAA